MHSLDLDAIKRRALASPFTPHSLRQLLRARHAVQLVSTRSLEESPRALEAVVGPNPHDGGCRDKVLWLHVPVGIFEVFEARDLAHATMIRLLAARDAQFGCNLSARHHLRWRGAPERSAVWLAFGPRCFRTVE